MPQETQTAANPPQVRKAYHAPRLEDYGEVRELTQAGVYSGSYTMDSGGSGFNQYVSGL